MPAAAARARGASCLVSARVRVRVRVTVTVRVSARVRVRVRVRLRLRVSLLDRAARAAKTLSGLAQQMLHDGFRRTHRWRAYTRPAQEAGEGGHQVQAGVVRSLVGVRVKVRVRVRVRIANPNPNLREEVGQLDDLLF